MWSWRVLRAAVVLPSEAGGKYLASTAIARRSVSRSTSMCTLSSAAPVSASPATRMVELNGCRNTPPAVRKRRNSRSPSKASSVDASFRKVAQAYVCRGASAAAHSSSQYTANLHREQRRMGGIAPVLAACSSKHVWQRVPATADSWSTTPAQLGHRTWQCHLNNADHTTTAAQSGVRPRWSGGGGAGATAGACSYGSQGGADTTWRRHNVALEVLSHRVTALPHLHSGQLPAP